MMIPEFNLKWGKEARLAHGSLWAFRNEIDFKQKDAGPGALVRLKTQKGRPLGVGFLNTAANLCFRLLARHGEFPAEATPEEIVAERLRQALDLRGPRTPAASARRLVFAEGDWLSGLVVDDYAGAYAVQIHSAGLDKRRQLILEALQAQPGARAIVERSDAAHRSREDLPPSSGVLWTAEGVDQATLAHWAFEEDGARFEADLLEGHKTGFFLDQRPARALARSLAKGKRCLDAFCYSGGFSVQMALGGAAEVLGLDQSEPALAAAAAHASLNGVAGACRFEKADVFTRLRELEAAGELFDLVVLDPPALAKDGEALGGALRGYKEINLRALRLLKKGGVLITASCTQALSEEAFEGLLQSAAVDAQVTLRETHRLGAGPDHPRLLGMPETRYLKAVALRVDR